MTTSMLGQKDVVRLLKEENLREAVKIMFGGAPVTDEWISEVEADGTAENAADAARKALEIMAD
jgi:monomethylamine corrinoid protein